MQFSTEQSFDVRVYADTLSLLREETAAAPLYLFSASKLLENYRRFTAGFPGLVTYAVKANPHPIILENLIDAGMTVFDAASVGEIELIRDLAPGAVCHFNNPVKSEESIHHAYWRLGVRSFAIDDATELNKIRRATGCNHDMEISVRFALPAMHTAYDFASKFGCAPKTAAGLLRTVSGLGLTTSLTFHPGSQCEDPQVYARYIATADRIAAQSGVNPARLNVGGGFPIAYRGGDVPALHSFFDAIRRSLAAARNLAHTELVCEPGRALVGDTTSLLCRVIHRRDDGSVFLNDGVYGGLSEQSMTKLIPPSRCFREAAPLAGELRETKVFGPTCDPLDKWGARLMLPDTLDAGDYVEFASMGAYGSANTTGFNGFKSDQYRLVDRPYLVGAAGGPEAGPA